LAISIIFPAFVNEYAGAENQAISAFENNFTNRLSEASYSLGLDLNGFDFDRNNFLTDEIKSQYISYIFSCSVADILKEKGICTYSVSGYSMGIYAALYYCGSITFNEGLVLLRSAWNTITDVTANGRYGMGMIIGLEESDILSFIQSNDNVEICNQNNRLTFIISGLSDSIERVLDLARTEGAMRANTLPVSNPYHSRILKSTAPGFAELIREIIFMTPSFRYISSIDQKIIETGDDLKKEVINNLFCRMSWLKTINVFLETGTDMFFECGAGDGLTRNARFIDGNFKSFSISKLEKFLEAGTKR
jgi:[acyl-carrier-protein] S-malonyltransferase